MIETMVQRINTEISFAKKHYDVSGKDEEHIRNMAKIHGMIEMLEIVTEKKYIIEENGLAEK